MNSSSGTIHIQWVEKYPDLMPGKLFFECQRLGASLTCESCHTNWLSAQKRHEDEPARADLCRRCPIGHQLHSGEDTSHKWIDFRSRSECIRCGRSGLRIIPSTHECVSCWNRHRETKVNQDARGNEPLTKTILSPQRIGLLVDGKPTWRRFNGVHLGEAINRALLYIPGATFHDEQPGISIWDPKAGKFQYRCRKHPGEFGVLREMESEDGTVEYVCPVCTPKRAKGLPDARVEATVSIHDRQFVPSMMNMVTGEMPQDWMTTAVICGDCHQYPVKIRLRSGKIESRCPQCDE